MKLTQGAIGNLINRYRAVLKKCHLINTFGSLAVASMLVMGGVHVAQAAPQLMITTNGQPVSGTFENLSNTEKDFAPAVVIGEGVTGITIKSDTTFTNNRNDADTFGGAVKALGQFSIEKGVTFSNNVAGENAYGGGALYIRLGDKEYHLAGEDRKVTITETIFINNQALNEDEGSGLGGAIALEDGEALLEGAEFRANSANYGGAIANWYDDMHAGMHSALSSQNTIYIGNSARIYGGAIAFLNTDATLSSIKDTYEGNTAAFGGAIFNSSNDATINGSTFTGNSATAENGAGGAIYNAAGGSMTVTNATFTGNTAALGGAINNAIEDKQNGLDAGTLSIASSIFENNQALGSQGGAIRNQGIITSITDTKFIGNSAHNGGAINNGTAGVIESISGTTFANNTANTAPLDETASYQGGAITNAGKIDSISDTGFTGNSTVGSGGAIANVAPQSTSGEASITLDDVTFTDNVAGENGGAIANMSGTVDLKNATISGNQAGANGSGIYNAEGAWVKLSGTNNITGNASANGMADDIYTAGTVTVSDGETTVGAMTVTDTGRLNVSTGADLQVTDFIQSEGEVVVGQGSMSLKSTAGDSKIASLEVRDGGEFGAENTTSSTTIGTLTAKGDVTLGSATTAIETLNATTGSVTFANGVSTVESMSTTGSGTVSVGGLGLNAALTINNSLGNIAADSVNVNSLGTLTVSLEQVREESVTDGWAALNAGGTLTVTGLEGELTDEALAVIKNDLFGADGNFDGLLDIGDATVDLTRNEDGHVVYTEALSGLKNNQLLGEIVDVTTTQADNLHGAFARVHVTNGTAESQITTQITLQLAGTANGGALAYADSEEGDVVLDANIGAAAGGTAEAALILGDANMANKGTLGDINLYATSSSLGVLGKDSSEARFEVGKITANNGVATAQVNVTGASLQSGAIDLSKAPAGSVVVYSGSLATNVDEEGNRADITFNEDGGTLVVINGSSLTAGNVTNVNTLTVENSNASLTGDITAVDDADSLPADIEVNRGTLLVKGSISGNANINITSGAVESGAVTLTGTDNAINVNDQNASLTANGDISTDTANVDAGFIKAFGNITANTVELSNNGLLIASANPDVEDSGNITIQDPLSGQGTAYAENDLDLVADYNGVEGDNLSLIAGDTLTAAALNSTDGNLSISAKTLTTSGGVILVGDIVDVDTWDPSDAISAEDSKLSVGKFGGGEKSTLDQSVTLTGNSFLAHGDVTAPASVNKPTYISGGELSFADGGSLTVGTVTAGPTATVTLGENSVLVVDSKIMNDKEVFTATTTVSATAFVAENSELQVLNAKKDNSFTVFGTGFEKPTDTVWANTPIRTDTDMLLGSYNEDTSEVTFNVQDASKVFPDLSGDLAPAVQTLYERSLNDVNADYMGVRFLSRATNNNYLGADKAAAASTIESAARMAFAAAVPQMTKMASDAATNSVVNRLGFANPDNGAKAMNMEGKLVDDKALGLALWIAPLWSNQTGFGMEAGNLDYGYNANLGGVSLGADYTWANNIRAGLMFNIGGGYAESAGGDLSETTNSMTFWGVGAYGGWAYNNFAVMADVSYTSTWNSVDQDLDHRMGMGDLEADIQASAISAGLRFEYKLETQYLDFIPHVGARYMSINTWGYDVDSNAGTVLEGDGFQQNIWTFPVGITFSKELEMNNDWYFKPAVDFTVIPAAGDIKAKEDVRFTGMPYSTEIETQMMDYFTWQGGVGLEFGNENMSVGVNYTLQAGQNSTGHGVFGMFRYEF